MLSIVDFNVKPDDDSVKFKDVAEFKSTHNGHNFSLFVVGSHSDKFQKPFLSFLNETRRLNKREIRPSVISELFSRGSVEDMGIRLRVTGWSGIYEEFSTERAFFILQMNDDLRKQVFEFSDTLNNYLV
jgi:hypothetical protein